MSRQRCAFRGSPGHAVRGAVLSAERRCRCDLVWRYLERICSLRVIHLTRHNLLRQYVSHRIAHQTNQWSQRTNERRRRYRPVVEPQHLLWWAQRERRLQSQATARFRCHLQLNLTYEELVCDPSSAVGSAVRFLGAATGNLPAIRTVRQNPEPLAQLVANWDEVLAHPPPALQFMSGARRERNLEALPSPTARKTAVYCEVGMTNCVY